jgi:hypothetical protein
VTAELDLERATAYNARHAGDVDADSEILARLVAYWQAGHALDVDGYLGPATRATVVPPASTAPQLTGYSAAEVIARLRPFVGAELSVGRYVLGGGAPYTSPSPFRPIGSWLAERYPSLTAATLGCDCSGMVAWASGYKRGNWNTDAIVADVWLTKYGRPTTKPGPRRLFEPVKHDALRPGDVLVYGGPDKDQDGNRDSPGHTGIVSSVALGTIMGARGWHNGVAVIHCSSRDQARVGAIRETDASLWWDVTRAVAVRCRLVRYG